VKTANGVIVCSKFNTECSCNNFLEHGESKNIMWQANECVVGTHINKHVQTPIPNHELLRTCAWDVLVLIYDVGRVKQLNNGLPRMWFFSKAGDNVCNLIVPSHVEQSGPICTVDRLTIIGEFFVVLQVIANEAEIICLRQVPQKLPEAAK